MDEIVTTPTSEGSRGDHVHHTGAFVALPLPVLMTPASAAAINAGDAWVAYCDVCRRWGARGSAHECGANWSEHLLPLLARIGSEAR
jgi:hypothetical protein